MKTHSSMVLLGIATQCIITQLLNNCPRFIIPVHINAIKTKKYLVTSEAEGRPSSTENKGKS